jgi:hypothetical protein
MKKLLLVLLFIISTSCSNKKEVIQVAAISCGQCQFELDGQNGCDLAVRIDNKAYFVDGFDIDAFGDAHDEHTGFCEVVRKAEVTGIIENGRFKATSVKLVDGLK